MKGVIDVCAIIRLVEMLYGEEQKLWKQTRKRLKLEVDCTHSSPDVTTRTGENEPFVALCFPTTQTYSSRNH